VAVLLCVVGGCRQEQGSEFLLVNFKLGTILRYKLVSERNVEFDFGSSDATKDSARKTSEKLELVIAYKPIEIDPVGLTTIEGFCESAKVRRATLTGKKAKADAVENLTGKTFTFKVSQTGRMADYSAIESLVLELGEKAFTSKTGSRGRVKAQDMISDFTAMQWYLWDSAASIKKPLKGIKPGQSWEGAQFVALPMPIPTVRKTTYTLAEVSQTPQGRKAIIQSSYEKLADESVGEVLDDWPKPYSGMFRMSGMFGFLKGYRIRSIEGTGRDVFNIDAGVVESQQRQLKIKVSARFLLPLGDSKPSLLIEQKISTELLN